MQLSSGGLPRAPTVLGAAGALGAALWGVPLYVLAPVAPPATERFVVLLLPSVLATMALAFACGLWIGRRRRASQDAAALAASQARLALVQSRLQLAAEQAEAGQRRVALLLDCAAPGAALFDDDRQLVTWNRGFAALAEVPEAALRPGLPLAELVRLQPNGATRRLSQHGIEAGVAGAALRRRADGGEVEDRWCPGAEAGVLLTCRPTGTARQPAPLSSIGLAALCAEEVRTRLPRLQAAIATGDADAARMEAHAVRGVAASFGLDALAETLLALERAARAGDLTVLAAASAGLPQLAEEGLRRLQRPGVHL